MLYKNISDKPARISKEMTKVVIQPGEIVNLSVRDINHSGSSLRFFEAVNKVKIVTEEKFDVPEEKQEKPAKEPVQEPIQEPVQEPVKEKVQEKPEEKQLVKETQEEKIEEEKTE